MRCPTIQIGQVFGKWTVVGPESRHMGAVAWGVKCQCGTERIVTASKLIKGKSTSCACLKISVGQIFGRLKVVAEAEERRRGGRVWVVDCSCGKKGLLREQKSLRAGSTRSCGCLNDEMCRQLGLKRINRAGITIGQTFGRLTVVGESSRIDKRGDTRWRVICSCGRRNLTRRASTLLNGRTRSCGCLNVEMARERGLSQPDKIQIGQIFGMLTIVSRAEDSYGGSHRWWRADCSCGTKNYLVSAGHLRKKKAGARSCGCLRGSWQHQQMLKVTVKDRLVRLIRGYRQGAEARGYSWSISEEKAIELFRGPCAFCGELYSRVLGGGTPSEILVNGIDRWNNDKGYVPDNCVSCCSPCNRAKGKRSGGEYLAHVKKTYEHCRKFFEGLDSKKRRL